MRIKEEETHLTLQEHDDDDDDSLISLCAVEWQKCVLLGVWQQRLAATRGLVPWSSVQLEDDVTAVYVVLTVMQPRQRQAVS